MQSANGCQPPHTDEGPSESDTHPQQYLDKLESTRKRNFTADMREAIESMTVNINRQIKVLAVTAVDEAGNWLHCSWTLAC